MSLHYCFLYIYEFGRLMPFMSDPCSRTWWTPLLFYIRVANVTFMNGQNASLIVLCIERTICILRIQNYENSSKPIPVAICLLILTGIASFGYVVLYLPGVNFSIPLAISTTRNAVNAYNYQISLIFLIFVEIAGVLFFLFLHNWGLWYRKKIRGFKFYEQRQNILMVSNNQPLFVKFQIEKTVQMTSIFLPIIIAKCSMTVFSASAAIFSNLIWTNTKTDVQMVIYELLRSSNEQEICSDGWQVFNRSCYKKFSNRVTFDQAELYCRDFTNSSHTSHLATFDSRQEFDFLVRLEPNSRFFAYWIGFWHDGIPIDGVAKGQKNRFQLRAIDNSTVFKFAEEDQEYGHYWVNQQDGWDPNAEPYNVDSGRRCVQIHTAEPDHHPMFRQLVNKMTDTLCSHKEGYICKVQEVM
uniref:C-type lectin domain-containing protein n=1 Tax=Ditylenchus dipsaci TaxID=166011 RepID=A0A915E4F3_9BILA